MNKTAIKHLARILAAMEQRVYNVHWGEWTREDAVCSGELTRLSRHIDNMGGVPQAQDATWEERLMSWLDVMQDFQTPTQEDKS